MGSRNAAVFPGGTGIKRDREREEREEERGEGGREREEREEERERRGIERERGEGGRERMFGPVPVAAQAQMSFPSSANGTVAAWMGVGFS